ncbi:unnamed protein product, partial [Gulo gulo]
MGHHPHEVMQGHRPHEVTWVTVPRSHGAIARILLSHLLPGACAGRSPGSWRVVTHTISQQTS